MRFLVSRLNHSAKMSFGYDFVSTKSYKGVYEGLFDDSNIIKGNNVFYIYFNEINKKLVLYHKNKVTLGF